MDLRNELRKKLLNEGAGYKYGCVMLYLDVPADWWKKITGAIEKEDVYQPEGERTYGIIPPKDTHVTVLYGLHNDIPDEDIEKLIKKMSAPKVTLKKISLFENEEFDVVKFDVEGEELFDMNKMFAKMPHTTDYPDYHPHCTVAYVKKGSGKKYKKTLSKDEVIELKPSKIVYSKADGTKKEYKVK